MTTTPSSFVGTTRISISASLSTASAGPQALDGVRRPFRRAALALVDEAEELPRPPQRARREEGELEVEEPLAVGPPGLGRALPERRQYGLDRRLARGAVPVELQPELHDRRQLALVEGHLPVRAEPAHPAQQRSEELRMDVAPRARDLLVEPAAERREPAEGQAAGAGAVQPARQVAGAVADQRHHSPGDRRQDDLTVAVGAGPVDLDVEVELVHVVAASLRALEREDRCRLGRGVGHAERRPPEGLQLGARPLGDPLAPADQELHRPGTPALAGERRQPRQPERVAHEDVEAVLGQAAVGLQRIDAAGDHREERRVADAPLDEERAEPPGEVERAEEAVARAEAVEAEERTPLAAARPP